MASTCDADLRKSGRRDKKSGQEYECMTTTSRRSMAYDSFLGGSLVVLLRVLRVALVGVE